MAAHLVGMAFLPYYNQLLKILETNDSLKRTFKGICKQACYAAGGAAVGGVVMGPPGALVGGIVGSVVGYCRADEYDSMLKVLRNLSDAEKRELVEKVQQVVGSSSIETLMQFIGQQVNREVLMSLVREFTNTKGA